MVRAMEEQWQVACISAASWCRWSVAVEWTGGTARSRRLEKSKEEYEERALHLAIAAVPQTRLQRA